MKDIIERIEELKFLSRDIYNTFIIPLHKQEKKELINTLKKLMNNLEKLAHKILDTNRKISLQYTRELDLNKMKLFNQNFLILSSKIQKNLFLEINKKEIRHDLVNLKEAITKPQTYYDLEVDVRNELNLFIDFLDRAKREIEHRYVSLGQKKRSVDELLKIVDNKDNKIIELNKKINEFKWLEAKEKSKNSRLSELERELLKKTKAAEQNQTLLKMHTIQIESELNKLYRHIRDLNTNISKLDARYLEKEHISLALIKELKDELLATRYALSKSK